MKQSAVHTSEDTVYLGLCRVPAVTKRMPAPHQPESNGCEVDAVRQQEKQLLLKCKQA
jgi:hypothetical protein